MAADGVAHQDRPKEHFQANKVGITRLHQVDLGQIEVIILFISADLPWLICSSRLRAVVVSFSVMVTDFPSACTGWGACPRDGWKLLVSLRQFPLHRHTAGPRADMSGYIYRFFIQYFIEGN